MFIPLDKEVVYLRIAAKLLQKDVDLQRFKLRRTQIGVRILTLVVIVQKLLGQILITITDASLVLQIELPQEVEERKRTLHSNPVSHFAPQLPKTRKARP